MTKRAISLSELRAAKKRSDGTPLGPCCPECGCAASAVYRTIKKLDKVIRERVCDNCGEKFMTREAVIGSQT